MFDSIPQDVVDIIVSHLGTDKYALKQCSLTSHSCLATSRKHLFSNVSLYSTQKCQQLNDLLTDNPFLATYIRHIYLNGKQKPFDPRRSHCWVSEPTLPTVLNRIAPHAQSLAMHYIYWEELSSQLQYALLGILHTSSLVSIALVSVYRFPRNHLLHLSHLRCLSLLSLSNVTRRDPHAGTHTSLPKRQHLQALEFDQRAESIKCVVELKHVWDMSRLRELCITGSCSGMLDMASSLLVDAYQSLEIFVWHFQYPLRIVSKPNQPISQRLDISNLLALRFLLLKSSLHEGLAELLPWLVQSLRAPSFRENLERVVIVLNCEQGDWSSACIMRTLRSGIWSEIDNALVTSPKARLRIVFRGVPVTIQYPDEDLSAKNGRREAIARQMPLLSSAGILQVEVDNDCHGLDDLPWDGYKKMVRCFL
ncbi:hypothetical protein BDZ94DRAFT_1253348 [Collybia nuda]|uniref:Uncharacterized protein n=1 Tax=Collybia nuda TaxID=64659 RepID=A0A9P5YBR6_9AGAR|nr:hypothetical protein BDZ94DRAFT_1253348 [Collybia nuda]